MKENQHRKILGSAISIVFVIIVIAALITTFWDTPPLPQPSPPSVDMLQQGLQYLEEVEDIQANLVSKISSSQHPDSSRLISNLDLIVKSYGNSLFNHQKQWELTTDSEQGRSKVITAIKQSIKQCRNRLEKFQEETKINLGEAII